MEISTCVKYVGVNDHQVDLFEGQYKVPNGMSYNSYVILDEKIAVMDTVDGFFTEEWLNNVEQVLSGKTPDYLVIQHMEPDHSASIPAFLKKYPKTTVVSTAKGFQFMEQFFPEFFAVQGLPAEQHIVAANDGVLELGQHSLHFVYAPMVHWPEVMMTYEATEKILFAADGFGKFGALDVEEEWANEARRYYIGIVGKYGPQVQLLLGKAAAVLDKIKIICPLHGPVWHTELGYIIDKYQHWSTYTPEDSDGVMVVYASMYGNTESAAQALAAKLVERGVNNVRVYDVSNTHVSYLISETFRCSHIVLASVTYNLGIYPVIKNYLEDMKALNLQNRTFAIVENGSWACKSGDLMQKFLDEEMKNMTVLNERVSLSSALSSEKEAELDFMADAIADSVKSASET